MSKFPIFLESWKASLLKMFEPLRSAELMACMAQNWGPRCVQGLWVVGVDQTCVSNRLFVSPSLGPRIGPSFGQSVKLKRPYVPTAQIAIL